jgi:hypothetical protein
MTTVRVMEGIGGGRGRVALVLMYNLYERGRLESS